MGLGIFTIDAGPNKFAIHQGANDGFRCLYIHCYQGPDKGYGMTLLSNGEMNGILFNSEIAQTLLAELKIQGVDCSKFKKDFNAQNLKQEEIVNIGYKNLVFKAFNPALPEEIIVKGALDPWSSYNLAVGAHVVEVSNQKFARAENLLSPHEPVFNPDLFGWQGKIMDSWETVRHNQEGYDFLIIELTKSSEIKYVSISTKYHHGNQAQYLKVEGMDSNGSWNEILSKTPLEGHALNCLQAIASKNQYQKIKVTMYPDGGVSRLGLYNDNLPEQVRAQFLPADKAVSIVFKDPIPKTVKPLAAPYTPDAEEIKLNWKNIGPTGSEYDVANLAFGGKILFASNEHYGPAIQIISPFGPMNMFDGFESARSRTPGHFEHAIIQLAKPTSIHKIEVDFCYFVNNNPFALSFQGLSNGKWITLIDHADVKAYAANLREFAIHSDEVFEQIKVIVHPDGGINRVRVFAKL